MEHLNKSLATASVSFVMTWKCLKYY